MERDEWLQERRKGIGASDSPALLGKSRWKTPLHVYLDKTGELPTTPMTTEQVAGLELEPYVARMYSRVTGHPLSSGGRHVSRLACMPWMSCTIDYECDPGRRQGTWLVECKTSQSYDGWGDEGSDQVPPEYWVQAQQQMLVTGIHRVDFALLVRGVEFSTYTVPYDAGFCKELEAVVTDFWHNHVVARVPPAVDWTHPKTPELVVARHSQFQEGQGVVVDDDSLLQSLLNYQQCKADIKFFTRQKEVAYAEILSKVAPSQVALVNGAFEVRLNRRQRKGYTVEPTAYLEMRVKEMKREQSDDGD
jgi:putative phage-type endonuclease